MSEPITEAAKHDKYKLRYDLLPPDALAELAFVYTIGAQKYGDHNWRLGTTWGRFFAAMMRHAWAWWGGDEYDESDGQRHLASVAWCALALMTYTMQELGTDDRPASLVVALEDDGPPVVFAEWPDDEDGLLDGGDDAPPPADFVSLEWDK